MITTNVIHLGLSFILCAILFRGGESCFFTKFHVVFVNKVPKDHGAVPLVVSCWSSDDNLGTHTLTPDQTWGFSFCDKPFATLFRCNLQLGDLKMFMHAFDSKWYPSPCTRQDLCLWTVNEEGAILPRGKMILWGF
ncbi:hypothetical protein PHJA_000428500 [Phtheirospermum japonicum]|uniref:S-protein homolog n=1 Tax=Phtheirospermum japonicum TaxID=374723 RepID=A0A830BDH9_9LAMI|nr:hypothetical protein PHJA_000428500 [Phtheirospermum japonicum]